eukprot:SAG31_NODE_4769_length_2967_cov_1.661437_1_plen_57_part_00
MGKPDLQLLLGLSDAALAACVDAAVLHLRGDGSKVDSAAVEVLGLGGRKQQRAVIR